MLDHLGVRGTVFCRAELAAPWAVETRGTPTAIFHVIVSGSGYVRLADGPPRAWRAGDLLLLPHGHGHVMSSDPQLPATPIACLPTEPSDDGLPCVRSAGDGPTTRLLCGTFDIGGDSALLLDELPSLLHVATADAASAWLDATLRLLASEVAGGRPGASTVVSRLAEVLLVHALRAWLADEGSRQTGWLAALGDPALSRALTEIHRDPARELGASELARKAGLSRSVLYARFTERLGVSPAAYLTRWRMSLARRALRGEASVSEVAHSIGYASEAAFSRAFKREVGQSPSAWRRASA
ncbi:MAG: AraC family transcriptional regulator [Myxococcales bacterium]|nr:AraC family transcriptional regulator [Myxococcales bacterium]